MDLSTLAATPPRVLARNFKKVSNFFAVEQLDLEFSNGVRAQYERLPAGRGAILAVPFDGEYFYLTSEYGVGFERYELGFVKGKIDKDETAEQALVRELEEEIGYGCREYYKLKDYMSVAPGMMALKMHCYLCTQLFRHEVTSGDEPEPIHLIKATVAEAKDLLFDPHSPLTESRSLACLSLALHHLGYL